MTLKKIEDRPTPREVYNWRIYVLSIIAALGATLYGYDSAFIGGTLALSSFKKEFGITPANAAGLSANIVSTYQAGAFFGALAAFPVCERFGRKLTILAAAFIFTFGAAIHFASDAARGLGGIYAGRVIGGVGVGFISLVVPIFLSEISPPAIRGRLSGLYEMLLQIGGLVGFWINYGVNETISDPNVQWRVPIGVQLIPAGLLCILGFFLVESPRWLRSKGRFEEADRVLSKIRNLPIDHQYLIEENAMIDAQLAIEREKVHGNFLFSRLRELALPGIRNRFLIAFLLFLFQNATGINAINYYSPTVFKSLGITGTSTGLLTTGIFGIVKTTTTLIWLLFLIDNIGRRKLFLIGAAGASLSMYYVGGYVAIAKPSTTVSTSVTPGGASAIAMLYLWTAFYGPSWNGTPWVYTAEIFPQHIRTLAMSLQSACQWVWQFVIARATPYMFLGMGYGVYLFFASMTVIGFVFVWFFVPETKGVPLEKMDELFGRVAGGPLVADVEAQKQEDYQVESAADSISEKH